MFDKEQYCNFLFYIKIVNEDWTLQWTFLINNNSRPLSRPVRRMSKKLLIFNSFFI